MIYAVGIGPGDPDMLPYKTVLLLKEADVISGFDTVLNLAEKHFSPHTPRKHISRMFVFAFSVENFYFNLHFSPKTNNFWRTMVPLSSSLKILSCSRTILCESAIIWIKFFLRKREPCFFADIYTNKFN